uniref:Uncharacterized protein n=1 Tax=Plectus sambesii TaxID=2011161 RepID=A0A914VSS5_9BILA
MADAEDANPKDHSGHKSGRGRRKRTHAFAGKAKRPCKQKKVEATSLSPAPKFLLPPMLLPSPPPQLSQLPMPLQLLPPPATAVFFNATATIASAADAASAAVNASTTTIRT